MENQIAFPEVPTTTGRFTNLDHVLATATAQAEFYNKMMDYVRATRLGDKEPNTKVQPETIEVLDALTDCALYSIYDVNGVQHLELITAPEGYPLRLPEIRVKAWQQQPLQARVGQRLHNWLQSLCRQGIGLQAGWHKAIARSYFLR